MKGQRRIYAPRGHELALNPQAFGWFFDFFEAEQPKSVNGVAVVSIRGPLMHHPDWFFDSYDGIKSRVEAALKMSPKAVLLSIDSPGGLVSGCFETAADLRRMCEDADVPLHAYVDGQATSAAYALACAASRITAPATSAVGSIGVIDALVDATANDEMWGVKFSLIASGARKTDGNPHVPTSKDAIAAAQARVDELAEMFFDHVSSARGIKASAVRALEAGIRTGNAALALKLVDAVGGIDDALSSAGGTGMGTKAEGDDDKDTTTDDAIAALRKAAKNGDAKAKKMLAALDDEDKKDEDADADADAEGDDKDKDEDGEKKDEGSARGRTVTARAAGRLAAAGSATERRLAALELQLEASQRDALFAERPDIAPSVRKALAEVPLAQAKAIVEATPKPKLPKPAAALTTPTGIRGEGQESSEGAPGHLPPDQKAQMDIAMGLVSRETVVRDEGHRLVLGATVAKSTAVAPPALPKS